ncbi:PT domain-containing protein [Streptomyces chrestomyceticus]|uniref:PT domain-containing protein n=1 Tax=Streptomyces chrestomyceticus TaxID=68185 RepID=UPI0019D0858F|nr:PT domain-containing protein [Streptomyces chrestomyceticus]
MTSGDSVRPAARSTSQPTAQSTTQPTSQPTSEPTAPPPTRRSAQRFARRLARRLAGALSARFARWAVALSPRRKWALFGCWFALDAVLALAPPVYWAAGDPRFQGGPGLPLSVCYFLALGAHISAGVVALYGVESARGEID